MDRSEYLNIEKENGVATIWLDQKGEKINKVSPETIALFDEVLHEIEHDEDIQAVVIASKKKDFIAGADIDMFLKVQNKGDFEPITRKGHQILNRVERSKKPVVAAIQGGCLGAGLEIALACAGRVASNDRSTKISIARSKAWIASRWWWYSKTSSDCRPPEIS